MDPALLRLALMNLVQNAIRYGPVGKPIRLSAAAASDHAVIEIVDEGPGIPLEHQGRIFERFYRIDKSRARSDGGAGLGLAIVKWAVERMNGAVELDSEVGRGSVFRLRLPLPPHAGWSPARVKCAPGSPRDASPLPELYADLLEPAWASIDGGRVCAVGNAPAGSVVERSTATTGTVRAQRSSDAACAVDARALWHSANNPFNGVLLLLGVVSMITRDFKASIVMAVMVCPEHRLALLAGDEDR